MDLLNLLNKVKVQTLSFEKHPVAKLDDEMKIHYLNGLSLIMIADTNILDKEKEYLTILINSFGLSDEMLDNFLEFAQNPDEKAILEMMKAFMNRDIKYNFIIDAMMMANVDKEFHENEKSVIKEYFEMFKFTEDEIKDLKDIYDMFDKQDGNRLFRYFGKQDKYDTYIIKKELFEYLLDYYNIDMAYELQENEKRVLDFELFKPSFPIGYEMRNGDEIMVKPVNNGQFCIFLNSVFVSKEIEFNGDGNLADSETKDVLMNLEMSDIKFENKEFIVNKEEDEEKKVTGVNIKMINKFIKWLEEKYNKKYDLAKFVYYLYMTDFQYPMFSEFYYSTNLNRYCYTNSSYRGSDSNGNFFYNYSDDNGTNDYDYHTDEKYLSNVVGFRLVKVDEESK